ncbi:MAG: hypothetical protein GWN79_28655, partial [Actinobacteria bacterium]|nr:hypothetical protein [Actinomycetota bacterium]NIT99157.1 hypothetical protein [Actinomycetota bacterium]NIU22767.1 hypothetical protein [Actinomycetota bacterium]NIX54133.1 hypothetical protein [Actinomycetota bacterium]
MDDLCSFLTPRLVRDVVEGGRRVVGLFDGSEAPEGRRVLERCGIETIVGVDAGPPAMVAA